MRWTRWILISVSVVVALIGTALLLMLTVDLGRFKSNFEQIVTEATGREFVIAGRFEPSIGNTVDLVAENVRLANADWGTAEHILELERVVVSIDTWSLLSGPIDVINLEVEGLTLHVEKNPATQQSSWTFGDAPTVADDDESEPFELPLWLRRARLQGIGVTYGQGWLDAPRNIIVREATLSEDESELLRIALSGTVGSAPINANGLVGPLSALLNGQGPRWELQFSIGKFVTSTQGTFRNLFSLEGPKIHAEMHGPFAERALALFGLPPVARGPVDINADLSESPEGIELIVKGAFGNLATEVVGHLQSLREILDLDLSADIRGPDLQAIGELFGAGFLPATGFAVAGDVAVVGDTLNLQSIVLSAGDARLEINGKLAPTETNPDARLTLSASGPELRDFLPPSFAQRIPSAAFEFDGIAAGGLQRPALRELTATLGGHEVTIAGNLPATDGLTGLDIAVTATGPDFDQVAGPWVGRDLAAEPYSLNTQLGNAGDGLVIEDLNLALENANVVLTGTSGTLPNLEGMDLSISLSGEDMQAMLEPWLDVLLPATPFGLEGNVVETGGALQLSNITYRLDDARGTLDGTTGLLPSLDGLQVTTSLSGPDASRFMAMFSDLEDAALVPASDFETRGALSKTSAGWFVDAWTARIDDSLMEMRGSLGDLADPAGIDIEFAASGPDLRRFLPDRGIDVPVPYSITGGMRFSETDIALKEVDLRVAETRAWFDGTVPASAELTDAEFDMRIAGPNLGRIGRTLGIDNLPPDEYRLEGSLQRSGDSYAIDNLVAIIGENDLGGSLDIEIGDKLRLSGELASTYLNLSALREQSADAAEPEPDEPKPDRLIPDTPLPLTVLDVADVDVTLRLKNLVTNLSEVGDVELNVVMDDDTLHMDTARVALSNGGTLTVTLDITRTNDTQADVQVSAIAEQYRLRPPIDGDGNPIDRPPQDLKLELAASGATVRELAASANGSIDLRVGEGDIDNNFEGYLMRDMVSQVFSAINPMAKDEKFTRVNCGFVDIDVVDGVAISRAIGLQTDKIAMASVGTVDLGTEALDFSFRVKQREGVGISLASVVNPYVKVGGTLASPALTIDTKRGIISGTVAALTGGLSILAQGVWDRYLSQDDYCQAMIEAIESGEIPAWEGNSE